MFTECPLLNYGTPNTDQFLWKNGEKRFLHHAILCTNTIRNNGASAISLNTQQQ